MNFGIKYYIDNNLDLNCEAVYEEPIWVSSVLFGATHAIIIAPNKNENTRFILVHKIFWVPGAATTIIDLRYPFTPIFNCVNTPIGTSFVFDYLVKDNKLQLNCPNAISAFSIQYQKISQRRKDTWTPE